MKLKYYFDTRRNNTDLLYLLTKAYSEDIEELGIWFQKLGRDTHSIRVDSVNSKLIIAMFREKI